MRQFNPLLLDKLTIKICLTFVLLVFSIGSFVYASEENLSSLENKINKQKISFENVYMPEVPSVSRTAAVYLTVTNQENQMVKIVGVSTNIAMHSMIHETIDVDGIAKMNHIDALEIKPNETVKLQPDSIHIMLMGLDHELISDPFELVFEFDDGATQSIMVNIKKK